MSKKFDFNEAVKALQSGQKMTGDGGILNPLIKQLTEAAIGGTQFDPPGDHPMTSKPPAQ